MNMNFDRLMRYVLVFLVLFFWSWGLTWYSIRAEKRPETQRNFVQRGMVFLCAVPRIVIDWFDITFVDQREHQEKLLDLQDNVCELGALQDCTSLNDNLYLLHYRFEGKHKGKVLLKNIKTGEVAKRWDIPLQEIFCDKKRVKSELTSGCRNGLIPLDGVIRLANSIPAMQICAPLMGDDFSLFFHSGLGYLYKLNKNSQIVWRSEELVHHSIELDHEGNIWTCSVNWDHALAKAHKFREDAVLCLTPEGKRAHLYSLSDILSENGLFEKVVAATPSHKTEYGQDPYHLNDVLPVEHDSEFWKKGDLFLSIRHKSLILQYRPEDGSVVWYQQGPWLAQHDINIVNESTISIFNNNVLLMPDTMSNAGSNIAYFNFVDGSTTFFGQGLFATETQGRQSLTVDDCILVEETNKGLYVILDSKGDLICRFYIPYYANPSHAMTPAWGRLYLRSGSEFLLQ
jgi:hypothetical protein